MTYLHNKLKKKFVIIDVIKELFYDGVELNILIL